MCVGKYAFAWIRLQICYTLVGVNDDYDGMIILARTQTCKLTLETNGLVWFSVVEKESIDVKMWVTKNV